MPRYIHCIVVLVILQGCSGSSPPVQVRVVDLTREFDRADRRPAAGFQMTPHELGGVAYPSIVAPVPSRLTIALPLPRRGAFHAFVALADPPAGAATPASPVRLRVGVSDDRIYEALAGVTLTPGARSWIDLRTDLSAYAGWKWSLFYRPDRMTWRIVLAADATEDVPANVVWGSPEIVTDTRAAREYAVRRQQLR